MNDKASSARARALPQVVIDAMRAREGRAHGLIADRGRLRAAAAAAVLAAASISLLEPGGRATAAGTRCEQAALPRCVSVAGAPVAWWLALKHPAGYSYSYLDASILSVCDPRNSSVACWVHGLQLGEREALTSTLSQLRRAATSGSLAYAVYNDEDAGGTEHWGAAHAKGVLAGGCGDGGEACGGFWLLHSAPRFPGDPAAPGFARLAHAQSVFGQHFACFSLDGRAALDHAAAAVAAAAPFLLASALPDALRASLPGWAALLGQQPARGRGATPLPAVVQLQLQLWREEAALLVLSKPPAVNRSLTDDVVGPALGASMAWETWRRSRDALPSRCARRRAAQRSAATAWNSINVAAVRFPGSRHAWPWSADHSKWGVSFAGPPGLSRRSATGMSAASQPSAATGQRQQRQRQQQQQQREARPEVEQVVCFGDLNRAAWQARRGGAYACLRHGRLWRALRSIVAAVEPCPAAAAPWRAALPEPA